MMDKILLVRLQFWYKEKSWALYIIAGLLVFLVFSILVLPLKPVGYVSGFVDDKYYLDSDTKAVEVIANIKLENGEAIMLALNEQNEVLEGQWICLEVKKSALGNLGYELDLAKKCNS